MPIIPVIVTLVLLGLILWVIDQLPGIDPGIKRIIHVVVIVVAVLYVLGLFTGYSTFPVLRVR